MAKKRIEKTKKRDRYSKAHHVKRDRKRANPHPHPPPVQTPDTKQHRDDEREKCKEIKLNWTCNHGIKKVINPPPSLAIVTSGLVRGGGGRREVWQRGKGVERGGGRGRREGKGRVSVRQMRNEFM